MDHTVMWKMFTLIYSYRYIFIKVLIKNKNIYSRPGRLKVFDIPCIKSANLRFLIPKDPILLNSRGNNFLYFVKLLPIRFNNSILMEWNLTGSSFENRLFLPILCNVNGFNLKDKMYIFNFEYLWNKSYEMINENALEKG